MIRHIVCFQLRNVDDAQRADDIASVTQRLEALATCVPGIATLRVVPDLGIAPSHWPLALVGDYETLEALEAYQDHPDHQSAVAWMNEGIVVDRVVVDFEL